MTVILLRHGRSTSNTAQTLAGRSDGIDLDEKGQEQARAVVDRIGSLPIRAIVCSPLLRCRGTVEPLAAALGIGDLTAWAEADGRFHALLAECSGNARLARMFATIMDQSHRARMLTLRLRPPPTLSVEEHRGIVAAIRAGDANAAFARARQHRIRAREQILPLLGLALVRFAPPRLPMRDRSRLVGVAAGFWIALTLLLTWQAPRGRSVIAGEAASRTSGPDLRSPRLQPLTHGRR